MHVVYDDNKNGVWDSGNVKDRTQPENIWVDKRIIALRANWEATEDVIVPREPVQ